MEQEKAYTLNDSNINEMKDSAVASYESFAETTYSNHDAVSAKFLFNKTQKILLLVLLSYAVVQLLFNTSYMFMLLNIAANFSYISMIVIKFYLLRKGISLRKNTEDTKHIINEEDLPTYSIIIPLYKEDGVIDQLVTHMQNIDYPSSLLTVFIVLEEDDLKTQEAFNSITLPENFIVMIVPDSHPKTKPKACNYAMNFVFSDIVVIYDAEDIPNPEQLKNVAALFKSSNNSIACVQCQLYWYNRYDNWLSFMFAIEYKILFEYILPALDALNMPIPLGGTSNHIRVDTLKSIGCWDPYNVTEDADLGIRLARKGFKTKVLRSRTWEEAPISVPAWMKQRTRWIKGYLQTFISHTRNIDKLLHDLGVAKALFFIVFIGMSTASYLLAGISFFIIFIQAIFADFLYNELIRISSYCIIILGVLFIIYQGYIAKRRFYISRGIWIKLWWTYPLYFILHIIASFRALYHLIVATHLWEKTEHNISAPSLD